uniref:Uncharacterized protein n=1 Tax=Leersia perrieri TaxID=77586 RepID=A0A0D9VCZ5_9ORYZ
MIRLMLDREKFSPNKTEQACLNRAVAGTTTEESYTDAGVLLTLMQVVGNGGGVHQYELPQKYPCTTSTLPVAQDL